jgi:hypothetical protein
LQDTVELESRILTKCPESVGHYKLSVLGIPVATPVIRRSGRFYADRCPHQSQTEIQKMKYVSQLPLGGSDNCAFPKI